MAGDSVTCPVCGAVQKDLWDHDWGSQEEKTVACGTCGADYILCRRVSVTYDAKRPIVCRGVLNCNGCVRCLPGFTTDRIVQARGERGGA